MKGTVKLLRIGAALAWAACGAMAHAEGEHSGYLADYSRLKDVKDANGETVLRYINPDVKPGTYHSVRIDPIDYFPAPMPTEQVSAQTLVAIADYMDKGLREVMSRSGRVVTESGPGVARIRPAITAVAPVTPGLKPYEMIPISFLISTARGRGKEAQIQVEVQVTDSVTGELLGAAVRKGVGAKLANPKAQLTLEDVRPLLDKWIEAAAVFMSERLK